MRANFGWWTLMAVLCQASLASAADAVRWAPSLDAARETALRSNRLVLVHFYTNTCPPCRAVDRNVFSVASVADTIDKAYVPVKVDAEQHPQIAQALRVDRWPTDIMMTPSGYPVHRTISPQSPEAYVAELKTGVSLAIKLYKAEALALKNASPPAAPPGNAPPFAAAPVAYQAPPGPGAPPAAGPMGPPAANDPRFNPGLASNYYENQRLYAAGQPPAAAPAIATPPNFQPPAPQPAPAAPAWPGAPAVVGFPGPQMVVNPTIPPGGNPPGAPAWPMQDPRLAQNPVPAAAPNVAPVIDPRVAAASTSTPAAPETANSAGNPPLGIDGYCPVTLAKSQKWYKGNAKWGAIHRDRTYLFKSEADQKEFLQNPDLYSPMLSGCDPVKFCEQGMWVPGNRKLGLFYGKTMYFFADEDALKRFWSAPENFAPAVRQVMAQDTGNQILRR